MTDEKPEYLMIVFFFRAGYPMTVKMLATSVRDFIRDNVDPAFKARYGFINIHDQNKGDCGQIDVSEVVAWQVHDVPESEKWKS